MSYGGTSLRRPWNRYPGDSFFCGENTIREAVFTTHLLDGAGAPSYFFRDCVVDCKVKCRKNGRIDLLESKLC